MISGWTSPVRLFPPAPSPPSRQILDETQKESLSLLAAIVPFNSISPALLSGAPAGRHFRKRRGLQKLNGLGLFFLTWRALPPSIGSVLQGACKQHTCPDQGALMRCCFPPLSPFSLLQSHSATLPKKGNLRSRRCRFMRWPHTGAMHNPFPAGAAASASPFGPAGEQHIAAHGCQTWVPTCEGAKRPSRGGDRRRFL